MQSHRQETLQDTDIRENQDYQSKTGKGTKTNLMETKH